MKHPTRILLSTIALTSIFAFAQDAAAQAAEAPAQAQVQAPAAATSEPQPAPASNPATENVPVAKTEALAPAPQAAEPIPAEQQAAEAVPAATTSVDTSATAAINTEAQPTGESVAVPEAVATANSSAAPADTTVPAEQSEATTKEVVAEPAADTAKVETVAAPEPVQAELFQGTEIQGEVHGFLKAENSPYLAKSDLSIPQNSALVIEPGVTIYFAPGTGISSKGQLVVAGSSSAPVQFLSANKSPKAGEWKGIFVTGDNRAEIRNLIVSHAEAGIAIENGAASIQNTKVENTSVRGIYARNADVNISDCELSNNNVALHLSNYTTASIERSRIEKNNVALLNSELVQADISSTNVESNETGLVYLGNSLLNFSNSKIDKNKVGATSSEILPSEILENFKDNTVNFKEGATAMVALLPPSPEFPGVEKRPLVASDKIGILAVKKEEVSDSTKRGWTILGNAMVGGNYHYVRTRTNHGEETVFGQDTVKHNKRFKNYFQVPGFGGEAAVYMLMQGPNGQTIEFNTDMTTDSWNHFSPNPVTLRYADNYNNWTVGDFQLSSGEIYMSGLPVFGSDYTLSLWKNNADQPLFQLNGFVGEARRSLVPGERHPFMYNDYIEDGEAEAQRIVQGGSIKWAPLRRFDAKFGAIYAYDELEDPILRDGAAQNTSTIEPVQKSLTFFADGNWLFFPGDIELNGQIAVGRADTSDVLQQRAINKVFEDANLKVSAYSKLRYLMQHPQEVEFLKPEELDEIFGDNSSLSTESKRKKLSVLIAKAKKVLKEQTSQRDNARFAGVNWGSQNFALGASLNWNIYKTNISGHVKYVGENFYSAGSPDQLSNAREFGARVEQGISKFWDLGIEYEIDIENASNGKNKNLFGLGEGTKWGLFPDKDAEWFEENELDNNRTRYIQDIGMDNTFRIGSRVDLDVGYSFEFQKQYRPYQLHGNKVLEDRIYEDSWFQKGSGASIELNDNGNKVEVDSARWDNYMSIADEPYLASKFHEKLFKHTWNAGVTLRAAKSVFKVLGRWTMRVDGSEFYKDSLIADMDLSNETWAKLGYYFGGTNYFEQSYPMSVTTTLSSIQNRFTATPRIKSYERDDMQEVEIDVTDEFEKSLLNKFLILSINGEFRYMVTDWEDEASSYDESEMDVLGKLNVRINHNKHFYSDWYTGVAVYYRPDALSNEYKDIYGGIALNYVF